MNLIKAKKLPLKDRNYSNALLIPCASFLKWVKDSIPQSNVIEYDMLSFKIIVPQKRNFVIIGPAIGSPSAILILERIAASGIKNVVVLGTCGAISEEAKIGDVLLPISTISEEGTSKLYTKKPNYNPSPFLTEVIEKKLNENEIPYKKGMIWSTDAPYMESPEKIRFFREKGAIGVDMELSALFAIGALKKINIAGILLVSDELHSNTWKTGFKSKVLKKHYKIIINTLFSLF